MSEQFEQACRALASPMSRRDALKLAATTFLAGIASTFLSVPALAHIKRHACRVGKPKTNPRFTEGDCVAGEVDCGVIEAHGVRWCCNGNLGQTCCDSFFCCPRDFSVCCIGDNLQVGCCPDGGACCGFTDGRLAKCCPKDFKACTDGTDTCCHKDTKCVDDLAIAGLKGCCPPHANGNALLCGGVCCKEGEECDVTHKQCRKKKPVVP